MLLSLRFPLIFVGKLFEKHSQCAEKERKNTFRHFTDSNRLVFKPLNVLLVRFIANDKRIVADFPHLKWLATNGRYDHMKLKFKKNC